MGNGSCIQEPEELDTIDQAIIKALREDGRMPFARIAQNLGVSPGMIGQRYERLVERGILKVVAITDPLLMGYGMMALVGLRVNGARLLEIAANIAAFDEVIYLVVVSGRFDLVFEVACKDHADLLRFLAEKLYTVEGVRESESFVHLKIEKEVYY